MKDDPASLDRLHDIVIPPDVTWWPLAPGWYVLGALLLLLLATMLFRACLRWQANAYRRAALHALQLAATPADVSEVLRRTALAIQPRDVVAALSGAAWPAWLASTSPVAMSDQVRDQLTLGAYRPHQEPAALDALRAYATEWIRRHRTTKGSV